MSWHFNLNFLGVTALVSFATYCSYYIIIDMMSFYGSVNKTQASNGFGVKLTVSDPAAKASVDIIAIYRR